MQVTGLDHVALNVSDIDEALAFYSGILGLEAVNLQDFRKGERGYVSLRIGDQLIDLVPGAVRQVEGERSRGSLSHLCLVIQREDMSGLRAKLERAKVEVVQEPVRRWGARGEGESIYVRDPDGIEIELKHY